MGGAETGDVVGDAGEVLRREGGDDFVVFLR